jgi:hypothetical protein
LKGAKHSLSFRTQSCTFGRAHAKGLKKEILKSPKRSHFSRMNNIIKIKEKFSSPLEIWEDNLHS